MPRGYDDWGHATRLDVPVFNTYRSGRRVIGRIQRGRRVPVRPAPTSSRCYAHGRHGDWLKTPGGYLCTSSGIRRGGARALSPPQRLVDRTKAVPFAYVKSNREGSGRYATPVARPDQLVESQTKAFFLAVDRRVKRAGTEWIRTVYGEYVLAQDVDPVTPTRLRGVKLDGHVELPVAFVVGPQTGVDTLCGPQSGPEPCHRAPKHSHFKPAGRARWRLERYVLSEGGRWFPAPYVRIARAISRPEGVPSDAKWVHIDLDQQTFVAYEGDTPQYVSLVSTGVAGRDTPTGLYRTERRYLTKTMRGPDETHGRYRVEEIPWTMYYDGTYAVHGAYWHNEFGNVRSHGCTNLAPVDAKWLFEWSPARLRPGWHADLRVTGGLYFYFTRFEEDAKDA